MFAAPLCTDDGVVVAAFFGVFVTFLVYLLLGASEPAELWSGIGVIGAGVAGSSTTQSVEPAARARLQTAAAASLAQRALERQAAKMGELEETNEQLEEVAQADKFVTGSGNLELFDHFGSLDEQVILNRMSYMVRSLGCQHIYLDHLTIIGSGLAQDTRHLDSLITKIRSFIAATKCTVFALSLIHI